MPVSVGFQVEVCEGSARDLGVARLLHLGDVAPEGDGTPWKISMEPENYGLEDDVPFQLGDF